MKKYLLFLLATISPLLISAQEVSAASKIDTIFKDYTGWFVELIFYEIPFSESFRIPWVLIVLVGGALYFTIYFKLINVTGFLTAIKVVQGKYEDIEKHGANTLYGVDTPNEDADIIENILEDSDDSADGEVSHFQALTAALSATVGLGNIAGVAVALSIGGPGATFWMIVAGILGMD